MYSDGIKTIADIKKRYGEQIPLSKNNKHKGNNGNTETAPIEIQKAAFLLVAMMGERITDLKGTIIKEEIDGLLKLHSIVELMAVEGTPMMNAIIYGKNGASIYEYEARA